MQKHGTKIKALLLMGGQGTRYGTDLPKQFHRLSGKKVYLHTLDTFLSCKVFDEILLVCHPDWLQSVESEVSESSVRIISGGHTRQNSTYRGLVACGNETDLVVIHDAVRPFVSKQTIIENLEALKKHRAVDTCIPSHDTIVHAISFDTVTSIPKRSEFFRGQTPQSFSYPLILEAHEKTNDQNASDDCSLVLKLGHPVHIVQGSNDNIKITTELDLFLAEQIIRLKHRTTKAATDASIKGNVYAITGGTGGIGSALATLLKQEGAHPLLLSTSSTDYPVDLTEFEAVSQSFDAILKKHGPIDGLINCVGHLAIKPFQTLSSDEIDHLIQTNLHSLLYSCRCAKLKEGAHIVNLSSSAFSRGRKEYTVYSATKAAIVNFTQGLAEEHPELLINALVPQRTNTAMRRHHFPHEDPSTLLTPQEVAQEILSILKSDYITGTTIEIRKQ